MPEGIGITRLLGRLAEGARSAMERRDDPDFPAPDEAPSVEPPPWKAEFERTPYEDWVAAVENILIKTHGLTPSEVRRPFGPVDTYFSDVYSGVALSRGELPSPEEAAREIADELKVQK